MKRLFFHAIAVISLLTSCSTSSNVIKDDAYYSPFDNDGKSDKELVVSTDGIFSTSKISSNTEYDYQKYYSQSTAQEPKTEPLYEKTETVRVDYAEIEISVASVIIALFFLIVVVAC